MGNREAGHAGPLLGLGFPALYETHPPENAALGCEGLSRAAAPLGGVRGRMCPGVCPLCSAEPFPCVPGTEQCLFRLWEKTLCKQQSVDVATSPLKDSLFVFIFLSPLFSPSAATHSNSSDARAPLPTRMLQTQTEAIQC